jgi:hypothetical protein
MKILYLILGGATEGVINKIKDKTAFMTQAGAEVSILIVSDTNDTVEGDMMVLNVRPSYARTFSSISFAWRFVIFFEQKNIYDTLADFLKKSSYDIVLMRYPIADIFLLRFMRKFSTRFKIVFEHNTLELEELQLRSKSSWWYTYFFWSEKWFGKLVRTSAAGLVGVTGEIQRRQAALVNNKVPSTIISNGIDVSRIPVRSRGGAAVGDPIRLLFLAGSEAPWHGVDILLNSLGKYARPDLLHCYIAGRIETSLAQKARTMHNVTCLDHQTHEDLDRLAERCDIGIGSLALFRNQMQEACTLKVREYWARGLPFVLGYDDSDLVNNTAMEPFYRKLQIVATEEPTVDLELVVSFARSVSRIENASMIMRTLALQQIDYTVKAYSYLNFLKSLCA